MRLHLVALTVIGLALLAACNSDDDPTPTPEAIESPSVAATAAPTSVATLTPRPTTIPSGDILFCGVEQDGLAGFIRYDKPRPPECNGDGFLLHVRLPDGVAQGDFVPRCLQPTDNEGLVILVGRLCVNDDSPRRFTTDPRPPELRDQLTDGALIPFCAVDYDTYPDYPITVGPPCIQRGLGPASIVIDEEPIHAAATCTASLVYMSLSEAAFRQLLKFLPTSDQPADLATYRDRLTPVRGELTEEPPERVRRFVESWPAASNPISINARIVDALDSLATDSSPEAIDSLRRQLLEGIAWYSAGRGC